MNVTGYEGAKLTPERSSRDRAPRPRWQEGQTEPRMGGGGRLRTVGLRAHRALVGRAASGPREAKAVRKDRFGFTYATAHSAPADARRRWSARLPRLPPAALGSGAQPRPCGCRAFVSTATAQAVSAVRCGASASTASRRVDHRLPSRCGAMSRSEHPGVASGRRLHQGLVAASTARATASPATAPARAAFEVHRLRSICMVRPSTTARRTRLQQILPGRAEGERAVQRLPGTLAHGGRLLQQHGSPRRHRQRASSVALPLNGSCYRPTPSATPAEPSASPTHFRHPALHAKDQPARPVASSDRPARLGLTPLIIRPLRSDNRRSPIWLHHLVVTTHTETLWHASSMPITA